MGDAMISYVIPTYYREHLLRPQLEAFQYQTDKDFEIIVTDDGAANCEALRLSQKHGASYVWNPRGEKYWLSRTVNAGLRVAKGDWLVILTNGCVPSRNMTSAVPLMDRNTLYTATINALDERDYRGTMTNDLLAQWEIRPRVDPRWRGFNADGNGGLCWVGEGRGQDARRIRNFWLAGVAMHRSLYERLGPLDESYIGYGCEDGAYAASAVRKGAQIGYALMFMVHHLYHPPHASLTEPHPDQMANFAKLTKEFPGIW